MRKNEAKAYIGALLRIVAITSVIVTGTVVVHESGHYVTGQILGCNDIGIVLLDENFETYTKMSCVPNLSQTDFFILLASGMLFVAPLSIILAKKQRLYGIVVFGFNLLISSSDYSYFPAFVGYSSLLIGAAMVIYSQTLLVDRHIKYAETVVTSYLQSR